MADTPTRRGALRAPAAEPKPEPTLDLLFPGESTIDGLSGEIPRSGAAAEAPPAPGHPCGGWPAEDWPRYGWPSHEPLPEEYWNAAVWEST